MEKMFKENIDQSVRCPITHEIFRDPVFASDGFCYERQAIQQLMKKTSLSPMTKQTLSSTLTPAYIIKSLVHTYLQLNKDEEPFERSTENLELTSLKTYMKNNHDAIPKLPLLCAGDIINLKEISLKNIRLIKQFTKDSDHILDKSYMLKHIIEYCQTLDVSYANGKDPMYYICKYGDFDSIVLAFKKTTQVTHTYKPSKQRLIHIIASRGDPDLLLKTITCSTIFNRSEHVTDIFNNNCLHSLISSENSKNIFNLTDVINMINVLKSKNYKLYCYLCFTPNRSGLTPIDLLVNRCPFSIQLFEFVTVEHQFCVTDLNNVFQKWPDDYCVELIKKQPSTVINRTNYFGASVLHLAVRYNLYETAMYLIQKQFNTSLTDDHGETVLHYACRYFPALVPFLLHDSLVNAKSDSGQTPLQVACCTNYTNDDVLYMLTSKFTSKSNKCLQRALIQTDCTGKNVILYALKNKKYRFLQNVLRGDINKFDFRTKRNKTLAHCLAQYGNVELVQLLDRYDKKNLDLLNDKGFTALHYCMKGSVNDRFEKLSELIDLSFNPNLLDKFGNGYVQFAAIFIKSNPELMNLIVEFVKPNTTTVYVPKSDCNICSACKLYMNSGFNDEQFELRNISFN